MQLLEARPTSNESTPKSLREAKNQTMEQIYLESTLKHTISRLDKEKQANNDLQQTIAKLK